MKNFAKKGPKRRKNHQNWFTWIASCVKVRSYRCKLLSGKEFIGFCKPKKKFYYGFKLHIITNSKGRPIEFIITPVSVADITAFKVMEISLPSCSVIYGDKAYTNYSLEDDLKEFEQINLIPDRKANFFRQHSGCIRYLQSILRKRSVFGKGLPPYLQLDSTHLNPNKNFNNKFGWQFRSKALQ